MTEILADLNDINTWLPVEVAPATDPNTNLLQIQVARMIRAQLSRVIDPVTMATWISPDETPDTIKLVASKLIAAYHFFNEVKKESFEIPANNFGQIEYNEAMAILQQVITGDIIIPDVIITGTNDLSTADFFPVDATDRAFTMGMNL